MGLKLIEFIVFSSLNMVRSEESLSTYFSQYDPSTETVFSKYLFPDCGVWME